MASLDTRGLLGSDPRKTGPHGVGKGKASTKQTTTDWFGGTGQGGIGFANKAAFATSGTGTPAPHIDNSKTQAEWEAWKAKNNIALAAPDPSLFGQKIRAAATQAHEAGKLSALDKSEQRIIDTRDANKQKYLGRVGNPGNLGMDEYEGIRQQLGYDPNSGNPPRLGTGYGDATSGNDLGKYDPPAISEDFNPIPFGSSVSRMAGQSKRESARLGSFGYGTRSNAYNQDYKSRTWPSAPKMNKVGIANVSTKTNPRGGRTV
jgi:hypothetical protein